MDEKRIAISQIGSHLITPLNQNLFINDVQLIAHLEDVRRFGQEDLLMDNANQLLQTANHVLLGFGILVSELRNK
jgi:hypothetical protein